MPKFKGGHIIRKKNEADSTSQDDDPPKEEIIKEEMGMRQLLDGKTGICTYLLWDKETEDAILIDPVHTETSRYLFATMSLHLVFVVYTHYHSVDRFHHHSDDNTGMRMMKENVKGVRSVLSTKAAAVAFASSGG